MKKGKKQKASNNGKKLDSKSKNVANVFLSVETARHLDDCDKKKLMRWNNLLWLNTGKIKETTTKNGYQMLLFCPNDESLEGVINFN